MAGYNNNDFSFEIKERLGVLSQRQDGWTKELNMVSWNGCRPKYDIREWSPDHDKMSKGLTFNQEEMEKVKALLAAM